MRMPSPLRRVGTVPSLGGKLEGYGDKVGRIVSSLHAGVVSCSYLLLLLVFVDGGDRRAFNFEVDDDMGRDGNSHEHRGSIYRET